MRALRRVLEVCWPAASLVAVAPAASMAAPQGEVASFVAGHAAAAAARYGDEILFDVHRNGEPAGRHRVRFARDGDTLTVESEFRLRVRFLFLTAYRFDYASTERWRDGRLESLEARIDDNGARSALRADRDGGLLRIGGEAGRYRADDPSLMPTTHWNAAVLGRSSVLNTLTGRINEVTIRAAGRDVVQTERGPVRATRYVYSGDLETEAWYDDAGRWVKLRFAARDGSAITYVCRRCQSGPMLEAMR